MKVIIVEDDFIVADHFKMMLEKHGIQVLDTVNSVKTAIESISLGADLYFVDIRLKGEETGIDFAKILNQKNIDFVFVSANNEVETLKKAASTEPLAYITKPYRESDIIVLLEIFKKKASQSIIEVKSNLGIKAIPASDILYIESNGSYISLVTESDSYKERNSLSNIIESLPSVFVRVHRSYLINKESISHYSSSKVTLKNSKEFPISRNYKNSFFDSL